MKNVDLGFLLRVFRATAFDHCDDLFWRTDGEYTPVTLWINCNDLFYWACADLEEITPDNIELLEQSLKDVDEAEDRRYSVYGPQLFCCRFRKMRPQRPFYRGMPEKLKPLFDACGPERNE